jgi:mannose-6-phosphate isomerase-like protein (cupin superfamily)
MTGLRLDAVVLLGQDAELIRYPLDQIWLRAAGHGEIQVADYRSEDREGGPAHLHPWDEAQIVVEGVAEFRIGAGDWVRGGSGTVQLLPKGVPHSIRVPEGTARIIQVSVGAPYDGFARDMARLIAGGAPLDEIVAVAKSHGVEVVDPSSQEWLATWRKSDTSAGS